MTYPETFFPTVFWPTLLWSGIVLGIIFSAGFILLWRIQAKKHSRSGASLPLTSDNTVSTGEEKCRALFHQMGHITVALSLNEEAGLFRVGKKFPLHPDLSYDLHFLERSELKRRIAVLLGGRAAEALFFDEISTGSSHDLELASHIASAMVRRFGMGSALGLYVEPSYISEAQEPSRISEHTAQRVDSEIRTILEHSYELACRILEENRAFVDTTTNLLLNETHLTPTELKRIWIESPKTPREKTSSTDYSEDSRHTVVH